MTKDLSKGMKTTTDPHCVQVFPNQMVPVLRRSPLEQCDLPYYMYAHHSLQFLKYLNIEMINLLDSCLPFSRVQVQLIYLGIIFPARYRQSIHMPVQVHLQ
jgi:hypothetical protein